MAISTSSFSHPPDMERLKRALKAVKFQARPVTVAASSTRQVGIDDVRFQLALRGWINPQQFLPPGLETSTRTAFLDALATDCETSTAHESRWTLKDAVRRCTLRSRTPSDVAAALGQIPPGERDTVCRALHLLYVGPVPDLATLASEELRTLATAAEWSSGHSLNSVDPFEVRRCAARAAREEHYERTMAGGFFGREDEFEQLRGFLTTPMSGVGAGLRAAWLWGPGGIGKSTLIAATALAVLKDLPQAAVAHLDFDRSDLDPTRSTSLDLEVLRQVGGADPAVERDLAALRERIREQLSDDLALGFETGRQQFSFEGTFSDAKSVVYGALDWLRQRNQPLILVLDTCEQLQAGGQDYWDAFVRWLLHFTFSSGAPEVRALLCGRADPARWSINAPIEFVHELTALDRADSISLLVHRGVPASIASAAAETFGGNPLMLQLVANLVEKAGAKGIQEIASATRDGAFPPSLVQGLLYDRFLKHINDPDARRYAHPGLILPELTPQLIRDVVAPVLGDTDMTESRANAIFDALRAAAWLTEDAGTGTALTQRSDVRCLMLRLMQSDTDKQEQAARLRAAAIAYHNEQDTDADRAFSLYHQLMTVRDGKDLARFDDANISDAMRYLRRYIDDFPPRVQSYLQARSITHLGPEQALQSLSDGAWTTYLLGEGIQDGYGERAVRTGDPLIPLNLWRRRPVGDPARPPTFVLQALCETAEWDLTFDVERALEEIESGDPETVLQRLQLLTRFALMHRPGPLTPRHESVVSRIVASRRASSTRTPGYNELCAIAAVAEAFGRTPLIPPQQLLDQALASETRIHLVRLQTDGGPFEWRPHLDALVTIQRDWDRRAGHYLESHVLTNALDVVKSIHGAPLDFVTSALQKLREPVHLRIGAAAPDPATRVALLRGATPEFYRPVRQALREAFVNVDEIHGLVAALRPRLTICPRDLEPDVFAERAAHDPVNLFLSLAQFADRARVLGSLLDIAHDMKPGTTKLARVRHTWHAWDAALCGGESSGWHSSQVEVLTR